MYDLLVDALQSSEHHLLLYSSLRGSLRPVLRLYCYNYPDSVIAVASYYAPGDTCHASQLVIVFMQRGFKALRS